jgi:hypothetical protein
VSATNEEEIVRVATGRLVQVELWQQVLKEAGIESNVVGEGLNANLNGVVDGVELWVAAHDAEKATAALERAEDEAEANHPHPGPAQ